MQWVPLGKIRFTLPSRPGQKARLLRQKVRVKWPCPPGKTPVAWRIARLMRLAVPALIWMLNCCLNVLMEKSVPGSAHAQ